MTRYITDDLGIYCDDSEESFKKIYAFKKFFKAKNISHLSQKQERKGTEFFGTTVPIF